MYHTKQAVDWHLSEVETVNLTRDEWSEICLDIEKRSAMCEANSNAVLGDSFENLQSMLSVAMMLLVSHSQSNCESWKKEYEDLYNEYEKMVFKILT